jgi:hypothetical protein
VQMLAATRVSRMTSHVEGTFVSRLENCLTGRVYSISVVES